MEVFIRDEDMPKCCAECPRYNNYKCSIDNDNLKFIHQAPIEKNNNCPLKSLDQNDAEVRAEERKKVVAELEKWIKYNRYFEYDTETQKVKIGGINVDSYELQQKLAELKGE